MSVAPEENENSTNTGPNVSNDVCSAPVGKADRYSLATHPITARQNSLENFRVKGIAALEEDIKDFNDRLVFKEKRRNQASNSRNYKLCDQLTEEMSSINLQKREREAELHRLQRKQKQAVWYK